MQKLKLKELEEYIIKNANEANIYNVINGLIVYVDNDPAAPANVKLLNRTLKYVFWLALLSNQKGNDGKKIN
jgi:hypothetical protein